MLNRLVDSKINLQKPTKQMIKRFTEILKSLFYFSEHCAKHLQQHPHFILTALLRDSRDRDYVLRFIAEKSD